MQLALHFAELYQDPEFQLELDQFGSMPSINGYLEPSVIQDGFDSFMDVFGKRVRACWMS